jgi:hypothetical protein
VSVPIGERPADGPSGARVLAATGRGGQIVRLASHPWTLPGLAAVVAAIFLWLVLAPLTRATNDADSAASVLYFQAIAAGHHLEAFVPTTPKPLLTLIYGVAWWLTHDWLSLTILTLLAAAVATGLAARLAARESGPAAAVLIVVALLAWPEFQVQVAGANSLIWGLALWLAAGLLATGDRPRPWASGLALLLAGLVRTETLWLLAGAVVVVAYLSLRGARDGSRARALASWPLLLGALALPLACIHDWLLTGQPLYWLGVPGAYTAMVFPDLASASPLGMIHREVAHYLPALPIVLLAALGFAWLVGSGRRALAWALVALAGGVLLSLVALSWRAVYTSPRYYAEADAPILFAAALGGGVALGRIVGFVADTAVAWRAPLASGAPVVRALGRRQAVTAALALVLAVGVAWAAVPRLEVTDALARSTAGSAALQVAEPKLSPILERATGATVSIARVGYPVADPRSCRVFVPRALLNRISVEMGVPTTALGDSYLAFRDGDYSVLAPGQWVLHIAAADDAGGAFSPFEISTPSTINRPDGTSLLLVPTFVDVGRGIWLVRVEAAGPG